MKLCLIMLALMCSATTVYAGTCAPIEYAELKEMAEQEIVDHFCQYARDGWQSFNRGARYDRLSRVCLDETEKMQRVFKRRFEQELKFNTHCQPEEK